MRRACREGGRTYLGRSPSCPGQRTERVVRLVIAAEKSADGVVGGTSFAEGPERWKDAWMWKSRAGHAAENPGHWPSERRGRGKPRTRCSEGPSHHPENPQLSPWPQSQKTAL